MEYLQAACNTLFAICAIPAAYTAWKTKSVDISAWFLWIWLLAELGMIAWSISAQEWWFLLNYCFNSVAILIIMYYLYRGENGRRGRPTTRNPKISNKENITIAGQIRFYHETGAYWTRSEGEVLVEEISGNYLLGSWDGKIPVEMVWDRTGQYLGHTLESAKRRQLKELTPCRFDLWQKRE